MKWTCSALRIKAPPTPGLAQDLPGVLLTDSLQHSFPGGEVPREGLDSERTTSPLHVPPRAGHYIGPVGGNHPLLRCPKCEIFDTCQALNGKHQAMVMCARGEERRLKRLREE